MLILKSILTGLAVDVLALLLLTAFFLLVTRRAGVFGIGPLRVVVAWTTLYLLVAFILGFVWRYRKH